MISGLKYACSATLFALLASTLTSNAEGTSTQAGIKVYLNQAKVVKLSRPAATVIVGNPEVVDATVQDAETIVLTARGFGRTNLVILDEAGLPVFDEKVAVSRDDSGLVRVYRRAAVQQLSCEPSCEGAYQSDAEAAAAAAGDGAQTQ